MRKLNYHMLIQWIVFLPLILSMSIVSGAMVGIRKALASMYEQLLADLQSETSLD